MKKSTSAIGLLVMLGLLSIPFVPTIGLILANFNVFSAKGGTVVNGLNGRPMADVYVIATASLGFPSTGSSRILYRRVTKTDAEGRYSIESNWLSAPWWFPLLPAAEPDFGWSITAFRLGYAIMGDDAGWKLDHSGAPTNHPASISVAPPAKIAGLSLQVDAIKMYPVSLDAEEMATYYGAIIEPRNSPGREISSEPFEVDMRRQMYDALAPKLCDLPSNSLITWSIDAFVRNPNRFLDDLAAVERAAFAHALQTGTPPAVHAGSQCALLKSEAGSAPE